MSCAFTRSSAVPGPLATCCAPSPCPLTRPACGRRARAQPRRNVHPPGRCRQPSTERCASKPLRRTLLTDETTFSRIRTTSPNATPARRRPRRTPGLLRPYLGEGEGVEQAVVGEGALDARERVAVAEPLPGAHQAQEPQGPQPPQDRHHREHRDDVDQDQRLETEPEAAPDVSQRRAESEGVSGGRTGGVVFSQGSGSSLNCNLHFHAVILDGCCFGGAFSTTTPVWSRPTTPRR